MFLETIKSYTIPAAWNASLISSLFADKEETAEIIHLACIGLICDKRRSTSMSPTSLPCYNLILSFS